MHVRRAIAAAALLMSTPLLAGCDVEAFGTAVNDFAGSLNKLGPESGSKPKVTAGPRFDGERALDVLDRIEVKGKAPKTGYKREAKYGTAWALDYDRSGCASTRDDILKRDMSQVKFKGRSKCVVQSGSLVDPYTGKVIDWKIGSGTVDIEHAAALEDTWVSGASTWGDSAAAQRRRMELANDPIHLIAADASKNRSKGSKNAAEWLPPNKSFRCNYVAMQIGAKYKYRLSVTQPEKTAMKRVLSSCQDQKTPRVKQLGAL